MNKKKLEEEMRYIIRYDLGLSCTDWYKKGKSIFIDKRIIKNLATRLAYLKLSYEKERIKGILEEYFGGFQLMKFKNLDKPREIKLENIVNEILGDDNND